MKNKIKILPYTTQYSIIEVDKNAILSKHIISNNGWVNLENWIKYFTYEF